MKKRYSVRPEGYKFLGNPENSFCICCDKAYKWLPSSAHKLKMKRTENKKFRFFVKEEIRKELVSFQ